MIEQMFYFACCTALRVVKCRCRSGCNPPRHPNTTRLHWRASCLPRIIPRRDPSSATSRASMVFAMGTRAGVLKTAAGRLGMSLDEYLQRIANGEKWCYCCRSWKTLDDFNVDTSRSDGQCAKCRECQIAIQRTSYVHAPLEGRRYGPIPMPGRDGDKLQARSRVNHAVRCGRLPWPKDVACRRCGHLGPDRRHEYHHHRGYTADHHYDVVVLCSQCHGQEHSHANSN